MAFRVEFEALEPRILLSRDLLATAQGDSAKPTGEPLDAPSQVHEGGVVSSEALDPGLGPNEPAPMTLTPHWPPRFTATNARSWMNGRPQPPSQPKDTLNFRGRAKMPSHAAKARVIACSSGNRFGASLVPPAAQGHTTTFRNESPPEPRLVSPASASDCCTCGTCSSERSCSSMSWRVVRCRGVAGVNRRVMAANARH